MAGLSMKFAGIPTSEILGGGRSGGGRKRHPNPLVTSLIERQRYKFC